MSRNRMRRRCSSTLPSGSSSTVSMPASSGRYSPWRDVWASSWNVRSTGWSKITSPRATTVASPPAPACVPPARTTPFSRSAATRSGDSAARIAFGGIGLRAVRAARVTGATRDARGGRCQREGDGGREPPRASPPRSRCGHRLRRSALRPAPAHAARGRVGDERAEAEHALDLFGGELRRGARRGRRRACCSSRGAVAAAAPAATRPSRPAGASRAATAGGGAGTSCCS